MDSTILEEMEQLEIELKKWKSTAKEYMAVLKIVERERDFWHEMATRGGGNG